MFVSLYPKTNNMKKYELEIEQDNDPQNPRTEWDNVTTMICFHKRYNLGDKTDLKSSQFDSWNELKEHIESEYKVLMIKPLYMYDHSGITISTSCFNDRFDSGQIGWVFIDEKQWKLMMGETEYTDEKLNDIIDSDVETYDNYITGEVYQYTIYEIETCSLGHEHKNVVESCGSFFDEEDCKGEGMNMLSIYTKENELQTN